MRDRLDSLKGNSKKNVKKKTDKNGASKSGDYVAVSMEDLESPIDSKNLKNTFERGTVLQQWLEEVEKNNEIARKLIKDLPSSLRQTEITKQLNELFDKNKKICFKVQGKIKELQNEAAEAIKGSAADRIKNIQYTTTVKRYEQALMKNNSLMEEMSLQVKKKIQNELRTKGVTVTDEELQELIDEGQDIQIFTDNIIAETAEAQRMLQDIEERHEELLKIERSLIEVRNLFVEMSILVQTQQEMVDRIELQASNAVEFVGKADKDIKEASKKKNTGLKIKIGIFIALIILIIVVIVALFK